MNRYEQAGVIADAARGKRVIVVTEQAAAEFRELVDSIDRGDERLSCIKRGGSVGCIDFASGGSVKVIAASANGLRGYSPDVVLILPFTATFDIVESALIAVQVRNGEVIR